MVRPRKKKLEKKMREKKLEKKNCLSSNLVTPNSYQYKDVYLWRKIFVIIYKKKHERVIFPLFFYLRPTIIRIMWSVYFLFITSLHNRGSLPVQEALTNFHVCAVDFACIHCLIFFHIWNWDFDEMTRLVWDY